MPRETLSDRDYATLAAFRLALRRFAAFSEAEAEAAGLAPQQHQALLAIKAAPWGHPPGIGEIAAQLLIRHNTAVGLVDRLSEAGLVRRAADPADRRRMRVVLTARAETVLRALSAAHLRELRAIRPNLLRLLDNL
ncbi:MAG: MarR family transcriptional regulator [Rhodospirillales bacterium]|nr:MarR family transcriptional regulator [Rhodospirillales bacterium]MDE2197655.1 MarR family transcriptional regulator [Rhodospirillales bacterium]MDE2576545.1 MarR family transcriptional regulator [Rhodospirillales bacterium]